MGLISPGPAIEKRQLSFNRLIWAVLVGTTLINLVWGASLGWTLDTEKLSVLFLSLLPIVVGLWFFTYRRREPRFALMMHSILQLVLLVFATAGFNYVTSTLNLPLQDEYYIAFDHALGFDWHGYLAWVHQYPWLASLYSFSYSSAWLQMLLLIILLFLRGKFVRLQQFVFLVLLGALASCVLAALWPAVAGYAYYAVNPDTLPSGLKPAAALVHIPDLMALREGSFNHVDLAFKGLITFPSYHSAFGVFLAYAFWAFKWLRVPALMLNIMLIASTPVDGGHYLADVVGGVLLALLLIIWIRKILPETTTAT